MALGLHIISFPFQQEHLQDATYHSAADMVWCGRSSFKSRFRARRGWNAVNYLAPLVTWRCGFCLCEGLASPSGGTLTALEAGCPICASLPGIPERAIFLTFANQIRQRSNLCLRLGYSRLSHCQLSRLACWLGKIALGLGEFALVVRAIGWFGSFLLCHYQTKQGSN